MKFATAVEFLKAEFKGWLNDGALVRPDQEAIYMELFRRDIANVGVAPFYYPWQVQVAMRRGDKVVKCWNTNWDVTKIPAGGAHSFTFDGAAHGITRGAYTLAIKVVNPMRGGKPLLFANQGQHPDGWLDLGKVDAR